MRMGERGLEKQECFQDPHSKNGSSTGTGQDVTLGQASLCSSGAQMNTASVISETIFFSVSSAN